MFTKYFRVFDVRRMRQSGLNICTVRLMDITTPLCVNVMNLEREPRNNIEMSLLNILKAKQFL
jgi:hypothetical protein